MKKNIALLPIQERYEHLFAVISGGRFLRMEGLNNEVPFFICPFKPEEALVMETMQRQLSNSLANAGVTVLNLNLYDLSIEMLQERGIWEQVLEIESSISKDELKELLQGVLDPETNLIPAIEQKMQQAEFDVMFVSGVGEVFPYIRSHNVLNNLQRAAKHQPTVMFFPGVYTQNFGEGSSLDLFNRLHDDKYYRGFNIYHIEPETERE